jgi:homoserine dehydrogenase
VFAEEKGYGIKLAAQARRLSNGKVAAFVLPQFVTTESQLYHVHNEFNGVVIESQLADQQFLYGKGAGRYPTSSAVVSDISALRYQYRYEYKKLNNNEQYELTDDYYLRVYLSFNSWDEVNKWDFESIDEFHSTQGRQVVIGLLHARQVMNAEWLQNEAVSLILLPNGIVEKGALLTKAMKKISLQLGGVL